MVANILRKLERVSIHAPRAGSDRGGQHPAQAGAGFNPRPPCGERRANGRGPDFAHQFQSTPPVRGATERLCRFGCRQEFQSTPPVRGATFASLRSSDFSTVSIHAPRAGSDVCHYSGPIASQGFNPRPPCGERRCCLFRGRRCGRFNPRPPCGERRSTWRGSATHGCFNPRPPCGERLFHSFLQLCILCVSIHAPRAGSDVGTNVTEASKVVSIHAPRAGSDRPGNSGQPGNRGFNPRPPCGERP